VYRFALQMTGSAAAAEDVTQETFLALLRHGRRYDAARGTVASFLYGIARNFVMKWLDRNRGVEIGEELPGGEDLLEDLARRETIENVRKAVLSLPPVYREAVVLCDLQDASYEEAALALDCPIGTVRSRLCRGRGMLARKLRIAAEAVRCAR
jgi:RNA polymerase sigma-70 factor (ECF subfamily)